MSVQTEISRLESAKAAIKTAIEGKGVTVPEATMLDGMASLIESIEAGGGNLQSISGSYTPAELETKMTIEHNLGVIPKAILVWTGVYGSSTVTLAVFIKKNLLSAISAGVFQFWANKRYNFGDVNIRDNEKNYWDENKATVGSVANISLQFCGGVEHKWMVFW